MPRTKRPMNKLSKSIENDEYSKRLFKLVVDCKSKVDTRLQTELRNLEVAYKVFLSSVNDEYIQMTIGRLKNELYIKEIPTTRRSRNSSRSAANDDGYNTENSSQGSGGRTGRTNMAAPMSRNRATNRRSRSVSASSRKQPPLTASKQIHRRRSRSVYQTPAYNKNGGVNYPLITPKVTPQTPLTVLRQPRLGEMVVSMSGSPVMVPTCYTMQPEERANCNILLQDGTMLSLQPKHLRESQAYIPFSLMDSKVLDQLKTLKDNLGKVVELGVKAMK